jgi:hypothetical protein
MSDMNSPPEWRRLALGEEINDGTPRTDAECEALIASYFPEEEYSDILEAHLAAFRLAVPRETPRAARLLDQFLARRGEAGNAT